MKISKRILISILLCLLFIGTYTSKVPPILILGLLYTIILIIVEIPTLAGNKKHFNSIDKKILLILLANFAYWITSGLIVGSFAFSDLLVYDFYQGTGRIFFTHLPLIFFCLCSISVRDNIKLIKFTAKIISFLAIASLFFMVVWFSVHPAFLEKNARSFISLMTGHTSAGTYFGYLATFLVVYGYESKQRQSLWLGILMILPLIASGARGALLSLMVTLSIYFGRNLSLRTLINIVVGVLIAGFMVNLVFTFAVKGDSLYGLDRLASLGKENVWEQAQSIISASNWQPGYERGFDSEDAADANVLARVLYWVYAAKEFLDSPIFGIGWDRFADINIKQYGIKGFIYLATGGIRVLDAPGGAHNAYLTFLCEIGLVGLGLNLWFWIEVLKKLKHNESFCQENQILRAFLKAGRGEVYYLLVASMTGHVLAAPTAGIPVLLLVGLGLKLSKLGSTSSTQNKGILDVNKTSLAPAQDINL
jgi:hypothetical protein